MTFDLVVFTLYTGKAFLADIHPEFFALKNAVS